MRIGLISYRPEVGISEEEEHEGVGGNEESQVGKDQEEPLASPRPVGSQKDFLFACERAGWVQGPGIEAEAFFISRREE